VESWQRTATLSAEDESEKGGAQIISAAADGLARRSFSTLTAVLPGCRIGGIDWPRGLCGRIGQALALVEL
jgi:hypothetical protein